MGNEKQYLKCNDCDKIFSEREIPPSFSGSVRCAECQYLRGQRDSFGTYDQTGVPDLVEYMAAPPGKKDLVEYSAIVPLLLGRKEGHE